MKDKHNIDTRQAAINLIEEYHHLRRWNNVTSATQLKILTNKSN